MKRDGGLRASQRVGSAEAVIEFLSGQPCIAGSPRSTFEKIARAACERKLKAGETVDVSWEEPSFLWIVRSGVLLALISSRSGRRVIVDVLGPRDFFGRLLCGNPSVCARELFVSVPSVIVGVRSSSWREAMDAHPGAWERMLAIQQRRAEDDLRMRMFLGEEAATRVLAIISWLHRKMGGELPLTREMVADAAGVATETAIRALAPLEKKGWIQTHRGNIRILRPREIARLLQKIVAR